MIIGRLHDELSLVAAREKLCAEVRSLGSACHGTLLPAVYRAALTHSNGHIHRPPMDFSHDAILYVTVIVVLYAAIIALLVGTNLRRRAALRARPQQQIVLYDEKNGRVEQRDAATAAQQFEAPGIANV